MVNPKNQLWVTGILASSPSQGWAWPSARDWELVLTASTHSLLVKRSKRGCRKKFLGQKWSSAQLNLRGLSLKERGWRDGLGPNFWHITYASKLAIENGRGLEPRRADPLDHQWEARVKKYNHFLQYNHVGCPMSSSQQGILAADMAYDIQFPASYLSSRYGLWRPVSSRLSGQQQDLTSHQHYPHT